MNKRILSAISFGAFMATVGASIPVNAQQVSGSEVKINFSSNENSESIDEMVKQLTEKAELSRQQIQTAHQLSESYKSALLRTEQLVGQCSALAAENYHLEGHVKLHAKICSAELKRLSALSSDILAFVEELPAEVAKSEGVLRATTIAIDLAASSAAVADEYDRAVGLKNTMLETRKKIGN